MTIPSHLTPRTRRIFLDGFELPVDIGFHNFEVGQAQRLRVTIEVWVDEAHFAPDDRVESAWNYDVLRVHILGMVEGRRFNLQESFVREVYAFVAARPGVTALRISTAKPDVYPDCHGVGVELASF